MITITDTCNHHPCPPAWQHQIPPESVIFDIETTGFSPKSAFIYLVGALTLKNGSWQLTQWLAESPKDEPEILSAFSSLTLVQSNLLRLQTNCISSPLR